MTTKVSSVTVVDNDNILVISGGLIISGGIRLKWRGIEGRYGDILGSMKSVKSMKSVIPFLFD